MDHVGNLDAADDVNGRSEQLRVPEEEPRYNLYRDQRRHDHQIRNLLHGVELVVGHRMMGILVADHDSEAVKFRLSESLFCEGDGVMQGGNVNFDFESEEVVEKPYAVVGEEDKSQPTVDFDRPLERHQMEKVRIPYLRSGDDKDDKAECVYPVPYSNR